METPDQVQIVQDYIMSSNIPGVQTFELLQLLEPIFEKMYDMGLTEVIPVRDLPSFNDLLQHRG